MIKGEPHGLAKARAPPAEERPGSGWRIIDAVRQHRTIAASMNPRSARAQEPRPSCCAVV